MSVSVQTTINHISICFLPQYERQRKCFCSERELKKKLRDTFTPVAWYGLLFSSNCNKKNFCSSNVSILCYKTNGKRHSVYYLVMDALGRFAKHSRSVRVPLGYRLRETLTLLSCLTTSRVHHNSIYCIYSENFRQ